MSIERTNRSPKSCCPGKLLIALTTIWNVAMMAHPAHAESASDRSIAVFTFNSKLEQQPPHMWSLGDGSVVEPVYVLPRSGDILAVVRVGTDGKLVLKHWTAEGVLVRSRELDVTGTVLTTSLGADSTLTLVTSTELLQVPLASEALPRRQALPESSRQNKSVSAGAKGAWFELQGRLLRVNEDGSSAAFKLPIYKVPTQFASCVPGQHEKYPCEYVSGRELHALADGCCLVKELITHEFRVSGSHFIDRPITYALTVLDASGKIKAQRLRGEVKTTWEWFWSEKAPSNPTIFSDNWGIVRTRYRGTENSVAIHERSGGSVLLLTDSVSYLNHSLQEVWKKSFDYLGLSEAISPSWTHNIMLADSTRAIVLDEASGSVRRVEYYDEGVSRAQGHYTVRVAVGQSSNGDWLIVNY